MAATAETMKIDEPISRVDQLLANFKLSNIMLVEWGINLLVRLHRNPGLSLCPIDDLVFLVPNEQLPTARSLVTALGFHPADETSLPIGFTYNPVAIYHMLDDPDSDDAKKRPRPRMLVLLPLSWTGIAPDELVKVTQSSLPRTLWTVPCPVMCAACLRIACRERRGSTLRSETIWQLDCAVVDTFFDTSYEWDYEEITPEDQPYAEKEVMEMQSAAREIQGWKFASDEEWMRDVLVDFVMGRADFESLPYAA